MITFLCTFDAVKELGAEAEQRAWKVRIFPVEVGCRGFESGNVLCEVCLSHFSVSHGGE